MIFHFRPATQTSAHVSASCRALSTCDRFGAVGSPSRLGHRPVRATARHTRVCLRVAVLSRWPQSRSAANLVSPNRSRLSPWSSLSRSSSPRSRSRAAFRTSRVPHRRIAAPCFVADYRSSPCAAPRREVREPARPPCSARHSASRPAPHPLFISSKTHLSSISDRAERRGQGDLRLMER